VLVLHVEPAPLRLEAGTLPNATVGVPYEARLQSEGGVAPLRWSGEPPAGLRLGDGLLYGTPLGPSGSMSVELRVRDAARQAASASFRLVVRPAAAAGDPTEWTPERLADEQHARDVAAHQQGLDAAATRARIAVLERRLAPGPTSIAAATLVGASVAALASWFVGLLAIALAAPALAYAISPALLAPARRAELERLQERLGCGRSDCPRCRPRSA
jgi:hypothetical protein